MNTLARLLEVIEGGNEHFGSTSGGMTSSARLLEERTLQLDSWRNEHFSSAPEGTNFSAQLLEEELFTFNYKDFRVLLSYLKNLFAF
ncbi:hypothetical protein C1645_825191 [Glomus cerebriforme]|uniref:Uncharacterized protein n=1 Tax=Glomus cerebriforme TaxID=658196 RepID=A0A397SW13_9GLOM|nr:hypothetical protein C1645_825191 [Glomus cerebriforme]